MTTPPPIRCSLERERFRLLLIDDAKRSLEDIAAGRTHDADTAIAQIQRRRMLAVQKRGAATPLRPLVTRRD